MGPGSLVNTNLPSEVEYPNQVLRNTARDAHVRASPGCMGKPRCWVGGCPALVPTKCTPDPREEGDPQGDLSDLIPRTTADSLLQKNRETEEEALMCS